MSRETVAAPFTGTASARSVGAARILRRRATRARIAAHLVPDQDSPFAASLRGKAKGFNEAADLLDRLAAGRSLRGRQDPPKEQS